MIQDVMRKHKRTIFWVILFLVIVPFVFWGGYSGRSSRGGGSGEEEQELGPIAVVNEMSIPPYAFRKALDDTLSQLRQIDPSTTLQTLDEDGTARKTLERIVTQTLVDMDSRDSGIVVDRAYLEEQLRDDPRFKDAEGNIDPAKWRQWVEDGETQGRNWNAEYQHVQRTLQYQATMERILSEAHVSESEVRQRIEENHTKLSLRYVALDQEVKPSEEVLETFYDTFSQRYEVPEKRRADFVALPMKGPKPALADELVERARGGEDFAELAKEYSEGSEKEEGGDIGWQIQSIAPEEHLKVLFATPVGEVSDPVEGPKGWYIYKVEDERTSDFSGLRDVKARQILIIPALSEEEKADRMKQAAEVLAKAKESGDLAKAAKETGLELQTTDDFSMQTFSIKGIPEQDVWLFFGGTMQLGLRQISEVIEGNENLYVAQVSNLTPPELPPLAEVRERVESDCAEALKRMPKEQTRLQRFAEELTGEVSSLEEVVSKYPDITGPIQEISDFTVADYRPMQGRPQWDPREVYEAIGWQKPGAFGGPVLGDGKVFFLELVSKTAPGTTELDKAWEEEQPMIHRQLLAAAQENRLKDYCLERRLVGEWRLVQETYDTILELNQPAQGAEAEATAANEGGEATVGAATEEEEVAPQAEMTTSDEVTAREAETVPTEDSMTPAENVEEPAAPQSAEAADDTEEPAAADAAPAQE